MTAVAPKRNDAYVSLEFGEILGKVFSYWMKDLRYYFPMYAIMILGVAGLIFLLIFISAFHPFLLITSSLVFPGLITLFFPGLFFFPPLDIPSMVFFISCLTLLALYMILQVLVGGTVIKHAADRHAGLEPTIRESFNHAKNHLGSLFGAQLLMMLIFLGLAGGVIGLPILVILAAAGLLIAVPFTFFTIIILVILSFIILAITMVYLAVRLTVYLPPIVLDGTGAVQGISRSWEIVRGQFWRTFGIMIIIGLVTGTITSVSMMFSFFLVFFPHPLFFTAFIVAFALVSGFSSSLGPITQSILYHDLMARAYGA